MYRLPRSLPKLAGRASHRRIVWAWFRGVFRRAKKPRGAPGMSRRTREFITISGAFFYAFYMFVIIPWIYRVCNHVR